MNIICTKSLYLAMLASFMLASCRHASLEDRAEKEAKDFTERYCPTPLNDMQRTDSIAFDRKTHTFSYYYTLAGAADNQQNVNSVRPKIRKALTDELIGNTSSKNYKENGYNFHYVFRSEKTKAVLYETTLTQKDYQKKP